MATYAVTRPYTRCPVGGTLVVQPMGDSVTAGLPLTGGWRSLVLSGLATLRGGSVGSSGVVDSQGDLNNALYGFSGCGSAHSGHGGLSAETWVTSSLMATYNPVPSLVADVHFGMLLLGANDVGDTSASGDFIGTLTDQWLALHPQGVIFVATRTPRSFSTSTTFNATVTAGVATRRAAGKNVVLVDLFSAVSLATDSYDGLHFNDRGNRKLADRWLGAMAPYVRT